MALADSNILTACIEPERSLTIINRLSSIWYPVGEDFPDKIIAREINHAELETADGRRDGSSSDDYLGNGTELDFKIYWVNTSRYA
jgi:hypothetical protein